MLTGVIHKHLFVIRTQYRHLFIKMVKKHIYISVLEEYLKNLNGEIIKFIVITWNIPSEWLTIVEWDIPNSSNLKKRLQVAFLSW